MYYDNKSTFYIKQYGPVVIVLAFSILLIGSGVFIYFKSYASTSNKQEVATQVTSNVDSTTEEVQKLQDTTKKNIPDNLDKLQLLEKSDYGYVKEIDDDGLITAQIDKDTISFYLIGIDLSKSSKNVTDDMIANLNKKKIKIAFDYEKTKDLKNYAYLYVDGNTLYNGTMLEKGMATLKAERTNVSLLDKLLNSEKVARVNFAGIWSK